MRWLVTGGAGFIGSNFIRYLLRERPDAQVVNLDALTYAGNLENLRDVEDDPRYRFVRGDIVEPDAWTGQVGESPDVVVHFAAESHVDRSIEDPFPFLRTNLMGTQAMLDWARGRGVGRFVHVSTDEVYGALDLTDPPFTEDSPIQPNSPYAASKAGSDLLARAAFRTHGFPVVITRCSNNYGPYQFPEKFLPLLISNALHDLEIPIYGDGLYVRDWVHVDDHSSGVLLVAEKGRPGTVYNLGGDGERDNLTMARTILGILGRPESLMRHVKDRPGHDRRYAIDTARARDELGWEPAVRLEDGLADTIRWYQENSAWWERVKSGAYLDYYEKMYRARLDGSTAAQAGDPAA